MMADNSISSTSTDWSKCCLCQEATKETLRQPKHQLDPDLSGYKTLAKNIPIFYSLASSPVPLNPQRLNDGSGIEQTMQNNNAKYHESCRLKFKDSKLERVVNKSDTQKRKSFEEKLEHTPNARAKRVHIDMDQLICFICEKEDIQSNLSRIETPQTRKNLKDMASELNDVKLMKSVCGDPIAEELKYHPTCLTGIRNRVRSLRKEHEHEAEEQVTADSTSYPLVFAELVTFIHETKLSSEKQPTVFHLADLSNLYSQRLLQLGIEKPLVNVSRLKERLLHHIPGLVAYKKGREILLAFKDDVGQALSVASEYDDAIIVGKAAQILRRHMLKCKSAFPGNFDKEYMNNCVPKQLMQFVASISHGADIKSLVECGASKADIALSHLLQFNCFGKYFVDAVSHYRHSAERESAFPVYMGLSVYAKTRKENLVNTLYEHGISISYDRVLQISNQVGEAVVSKYSEIGVVCPPRLIKGTFTTSAVDNIDHNPSATTATSSFHGTSISLFQHESRHNHVQEKLELKSNIKKIPKLPESFTNVRPTFLKETKPLPNVFAPPISPEPINSYLSQEYGWLEKIHLSEVFDQSVKVTWSVHHAAQRRNHEFEVGISALLPLLRDHAHDIATIKHAMDKVKEAIAYLNPSQTPVITADQPLFALAKQIQWTWPEGYGNFVVMFGDLHIEMAALKMIGSILKGSGWTIAIEESSIASSGTAESFMHATNVTKTRRAHQVTACALYNLMKSAFEKEKQDIPDNVGESFEEWHMSRCTEQPCFKYWNMILEIELLILVFVRSLREANFDAYKMALANMLPLFFANDNIHYSRWLTIHLNDLTTLKDSHPDIAEEFQAGKFVVHKTNRAFSGIGTDQAHEQNNAIVKGDGGAIGITENPSALLRWMVSGPEVSQLIQEYEESSRIKHKVKTEHHEDTPSAQEHFYNDVKNLTACIEELGNPFLEDSKQLLTLDSKDVSDANALNQFKQRGNEQSATFRESHEKFYDPIKKNKFNLFGGSDSRKQKGKRNILKQDCALFSNLFITCQNRQLDLNEFFRYENQPFPASLSNNGELYQTQKSDLVNALEELVETESNEPNTEAIMIDGTSLCYSLSPSENTFESYADKTFTGKISGLARKHKRVDVVFDQYKTNSLKQYTRNLRGIGSRRKVTKTGRIPRNWPNFLQNDDNKKELFPLLADSLKDTNCGIVYASKNDNTVCNQFDREGFSCSHEEADTRLFLHLKHAVENDNVKTASILSNDTDIVVIAIHVFHQLNSLGLLELWVAFGSVKTRRWLPIHDLVTTLGLSKCQGLLFFHSFSGCDTVSGFKGKGKKSFLRTWDVFPDVTEAFINLGK